jgi:polar amino acid transport system substrate-binding protein
MGLYMPSFRLAQRCATLCAVICCFFSSAQASDAPLQVLYSERPPYMMASADGGPSGLTGAPGTRAFKLAGVSVRWQALPTNRQLLMIRDGSTPACAIGWFRTPERELYAKFTRAIYHDKDWTVLARSSLADKGDTSLQELMQRKDVRILIKDNYSYGNELDKLLARTNPLIAISTAPTLKMVQSISLGAADMMFVSEEEGSYIMEHHLASQTSKLRLLRFKDMPHGPERYIMCSKTVPDALIARLNQAIASH